MRTERIMVERLFNDSEQSSKTDAVDDEDIYTALGLASTAWSAYREELDNVTEGLEEKPSPSELADEYAGELARELENRFGEKYDQQTISKMWRSLSGKYINELFELEEPQHTEYL